MKLIVDMNLSPRWVELLIANGTPAVHWATLGRADAPDIAIMEYAKVYDFAVLTSDLDFGIRLVLTGEDKPSVIQLRSRDLDPDFLGPQVLLALEQLASDVERPAPVTVDPERTRVRLLPLQRG